MVIFVLVIVGLVLGFLFNLATRPMQTLVKTMRVLIFGFGVLCLLGYFFSSNSMTGEEMPPDAQSFILQMTIGVFVLWALTFIVPLILRMVLRPRSRDY